MAYRNYEDGTYLLDGVEITVENGRFEMDGEVYQGFGYDDGRSDTFLMATAKTAAYPITFLFGDLFNTMSRIPGGGFNELFTKVDYIIDHTELDHSKIQRLDGPAAELAHDL